MLVDILLSKMTSVRDGYFERPFDSEASCEMGTPRFLLGLNFPMMLTWSGPQPPLNFTI